GVGVVLFPNTTIQRAWNKITPQMLSKEGPFSQNVVDALQLPQETVAIMAAVILSIVLIALVRIFVITYNPAIATTIYFYFLGAIAVISLLIQMDFTESYTRILVDYLVGDKFLVGSILIGVGSLVALFTEGILTVQQVVG